MVLCLSFGKCIVQDEQHVLTDEYVSVFGVAVVHPMPDAGSTIDQDY